MSTSTGGVALAGLADAGRLDFRTSRSGETATSSLQRALGLQYRYQPARLAIGRSLSIPAQPSAVDNLDGRTIRGETLFGVGADGLGVWMSLLIEHAGRGPLGRRELQDLVAAHWARGAGLLWDALRGREDPVRLVAELSLREYRSAGAKASVA